MVAVAPSISQSETTGQSGYVSFSRFTDPGAQSAMLDALPHSPEAIAAVAQNPTVHHNLLPYLGFDGYSFVASAPVRVLFIGNSYTFYNDLPGVLERMAAANGRRLTTQFFARGGASLQNHWNDGDAARALQDARWDFVVLQERSVNVRGELGLAIEYARLFDAEIRKAGAQTLLYATPAQRGEVDKLDATYHGYLEIAHELNARVVPVGPAFQEVYNAVPGITLHADDRVHPGAKGSVLAAMIFYTVIFGEPPVTLEIEGVPLTKAEAAAFRKSAAAE